MAISGFTITEFMHRTAVYLRCSW